MSYSRQIRRAAERRAQKEARKQQRAATVLAETQVQPLAEPDPDGELSEEQFLKDIATMRELGHPKNEPPRTGPTGPRTPEGKAISSLNNLKHGLTGAFRVLEFESQADFDAAHEALITEHQPGTPTESELVRRVAEHAWLSRRAQNLLDLALAEGDDKRFALYLRYQTTNDRGFRACLNDLLRLRRESRQAQKEFESQNRAAESHAARVRLANARAMHLEIDSEIKSYVEAPIPGYSSIPVEDVKQLFQSAMLSLHSRKLAENAA